MSSSTNKSIADREQAKSHHRLDEERHGKYSIDNEPSKRGEPDDRGRKIEREVMRRAKKK